MSYKSKVNAINHLESYYDCSIGRLDSNESSIELIKELYEFGAKAVWFVNESSNNDDYDRYGDTIYLELEDEISIDLAMVLIDLRPDECSYEHENEDEEDFKYIRLWWD